MSDNREKIKMWAPTEDNHDAYDTTGKNQE
jgi:hypothetical protein